MTATIDSPVLAAVADGPGVAAVRRARHRLGRRTLTVCVALALVLLGVFLAALVVGDFPLTVQQVVSSLVGRGTRASDFIVYELRLPRAVTGMAVGACFGLSGAIFQSMMRNPLASPDIIGITSGASASAVVAILMLGLSGLAVSAFSFAGALFTALLIYVLA